MFEWIETFYNKCYLLPELIIPALFLTMNLQWIKKHWAKKKKADAMMMFDLLILYTKISQDKPLTNIYLCFDDN